MAMFLEISKVQYRCSCTALKPFCYLYLCRHCLSIRCKDCLLHEIDGCFCPHCLEIFPPKEAKLFDHKCKACFDCPRCSTTLSVRATSAHVQAAVDSGTTTSRKMYYMVCNFCHWSTRDSHIPDQGIARDGFVNEDNPDLPRFKNILDYNHKLAIKESLDIGHKKYAQKRKQRLYTDKFYSAISALPGSRIQPASSEDQNINIEPGATVTEFPAIGDDFFTSEKILDDIPTLEQTLRNPTSQPKSRSDLQPIRKSLAVRKSYRCKVCEHNICKPDFQPKKPIKFKIIMATLHHIPEVRMMNKCLLQTNKESPVVLTLTNPAIFNARVQLKQNDCTDVTAKIFLPDCEFVLGHSDHLAFNAGDSKQGYNDDRSIVIFRNANKIGIVVKVLPTCESGSVVASFTLCHEYHNTTISLPGDKNEVEVVWLEHTVYLNLGEIE